MLAIPFKRSIKYTEISFVKRYLLLVLGSWCE